MRFVKDPDVYRGVVKKQIKDWLSIVTQRKNQEWLLLQVLRPEARLATGGGGFFAMKGSILDRMKADFNTDKRDRYCLSVSRGGHRLTCAIDASNLRGQLAKRIQWPGQN